MKTLSWTSDKRWTIVLESNELGRNAFSKNKFFTIRVMHESPEQAKAGICSKDWYYTLEPGFGSFAHAAAKAVEKAESEEESIMLAAVAGQIPDFIFRFRENMLVSVKDVAEDKIIWESGKQAQA